MASGLSVVQALESKPCEAIVNGLRDLLRRAENGEVIGLACAVQLTGREIAGLIVRGEGGSIFTLLGAVTELQYRICHEHMGQPEVEP